MHSESKILITIIKCNFLFEINYLYLRIIMKCINMNVVRRVKKVLNVSKKKFALQIEMVGNGPSSLWSSWTR